MLSLMIQIQKWKSYPNNMLLNGRGISETDIYSLRLLIETVWSKQESLTFLASPLMFAISTP